MAFPMKKKRSWPRRIGLFFAGLAVLLAVLAAVGVIFAPDYTAKKNPAGHAVNTIHYLQLDERTSIFISAWLPLRLAPGKKIPALIRTERYAEQLESGWLAKVLQFYAGEQDENYKGAKPLLAAGYAFVLVQSPGSCQSSGPRPAEYPPREVDAIGLAIDWIARQPWSNGRVGAYGGSYSGTTADMSCAALRPQLRAVYPSKPDFDPYTGVIRPGGLGSTAFIRTWGNMIRAMDADDIIGAVEAGSGETLPFWQRWLYRSMVSGLKRPGRKDMATFRRALADHRANISVDQLLKSTEFRDSRLTAGGLAMHDIALYSYKEKIEQAAVSTYTRVGWIDAGAAEGALQKFLTFNTPQKLVLLPTGHSQGEFVDLFGDQPDRQPQEPGWLKTDMLDYFDRHLKGPATAPEPRRIVYFTYGANTWRETAAWPPQGIGEQEWFFRENRSLAPEPPTATEGADVYRVDFTADSGKTNRWMGQMGWPVQYGDRVQEDRKLLTYTSDPLASDLEITGSPTVYLQVASTHSDGAFHVYLEDVAPAGRVSYLSEGLLRGIHRRTKPAREAPCVPLGVYHTFFKADALPLVPGEIAELPITMVPISVLVRKGHAIRIAVAGFDRALGDRYPEKGDPVLAVQRNAARPSRVVLPVRTE
jgi:putative CocE/NonD family hydrolase